MPSKDRKTIRFRGVNENVLETFRLRGRSYYVLEKLSRRGAYRVFDPHAGPHGDYRILYELSDSKSMRQSLEVLRRLGVSSNRNFPGIVDFVRQNGQLFVVVAWVTGNDLRHYLRSVRTEKVPRPSSTEVVRLIRGLVHGVAHYHRRTNIIHGDISPANLILTSGPTQLVLVDFGSAWPIEKAATKSTGDGVTEPYAAPERLTSHAAEDFRSDMFSIGVVCYELLTLAVPFGGLGGRAGTPTLAEKMSNAFEAPSKLMYQPKLPRRCLNLLDECLATSMALNPNDRFPTTSDWIKAWDTLHSSFKNGSTLSPFESFVADKIASVVTALRGKSSK